MAEHDMTCRELSQHTTAYLDFAMPPRLRTTFEQHLVFCPYCAVHLEQVRATREILASLGAVAPPDRTVRAVLKGLADPGG